MKENSPWTALHCTLLSLLSLCSSSWEKFPHLKQLRVPQSQTAGKTLFLGEKKREEKLTPLWLLWTEQRRPSQGGLFHSEPLTHGSAQVNQLQIATVVRRWCAELSETWWKSQITKERRKRNPSAFLQKPRKVRKSLPLGSCPTFFNLTCTLASFKHPFSGEWHQKCCPRRSYKRQKQHARICSGSFSDLIHSIQYVKDSEAWNNLAFIVNANTSEAIHSHGQFFARLWEKTKQKNNSSPITQRLACGVLTHGRRAAWKNIKCGTWAKAAFIRCASVPSWLYVFTVSLLSNGACEGEWFKVSGRK